MPVGSVKDVKLEPGQHRRRHVRRRRALPALHLDPGASIRYQNLVGDRYLEITSGPGELRKLPPGGTIAKDNTQPALDLDALLGGLRPVLKGLDGNKVNEVSNAVIELLQGQGGALSNLLASTGSFTQDLAARDQLIGDVINNLNTVLGHGRRQGRAVQRQRRPAAAADHRAGRRTATRSPAPSRRWRRPTNDLTDMLQNAPPTAAGRDREPPAARQRAGRAQGRRQQGHRAAGRELPAAQRTWCLRLVLQHLLLLDPDQDQRPGGQRHPHPVRWSAGSVEGEVPSENG